MLAASPIITGSQFLEAAAGGQRLVFRFSDDVGQSLSNSDLILHNLSTGQTISPAQIHLSFDSSSRFAIFTFPGVTSGLLPDGRYLALLKSEGIEAGGLLLDGNQDGIGGDDAVFSFSYLQGDLNRDGTVDATDVSAINVDLGHGVVSPDQGDFNGDGEVDFSDLVTVAQHYGQSVSRLADGDANLDGTVNFADLVAVAQHYGDAGVGDLNGDGRIDTADLQIVNHAQGQQLPALDSINSLLPYDSGISADDSISNDITLDGLISANATVADLRVGVDAMPSADYVSALADVQPGGGFSLPRTRLEQLLGVQLSDGPHVLHLQSFGPGSVLLGSKDVSITLDTTAPEPPVFDLAPGYASGPGSTSFKAPFLEGTAEAGATISLGTSTTTADASGHFILPALLNIGSNNVALTATDLAGNTSSSATHTFTRTGITTSNQVAIDWNTATLNAITLDATVPPAASRALAMVSAAMYDAANSISGASSFLYVHVNAPSGSSGVAAVAQAAHDVLSYLYPAQQAIFDAQLTTSLSTVSDGAAKLSGIAAGQQVAAAIIGQRANDGSLDYSDYTPGSGLGVWEPTYPSYAAALLPAWATLKPFLMTSDSQFRPAGPPALNSSQWVADYDQVKSLGSATSTTRTADQTQIARFWADGQGTVTPPGHWNLIAMQLLQDKGNVSLVDTLKLLAQLNVSMGDAAIVAWDAKYTDNFWRPITAIQAGGGNAALTADPNWTPLLGTPNFPEYVSGHSTFSGAAAVILSNFFGANTPFSTTSPSPGVSGVVRNYASFDAAASEAGMSRIYGGIHYLTSNLDGSAAGKALANYVLAHFDESTDTVAPKVTFGNTNHAAVKQNFTLQGLVTDNLSGVKTLTAQLDTGAPFDVTVDSSGHFSITTSLASNGSADGVHVLHLIAIDYANNASASYDYTFTLDTAAPSITLASPTGTQPITLTPATTLSGIASGTGSPLVALSYQFDSGMVMPLSFSPADGSFSTLPDLSKLGTGNHTLKITATDAAGNSITTTLNVTLAAMVPLTVSNFTPSQGASDVGATYRPEIFFSRPINTATLTSNNFFATDTTGAKLPATIVPSNDGTYAWLFLTDSMPGASTITITVDGATIKAADNTLLDAAGTGTAGSKLTYSFSTVSTATLPNTSLSGTIADPGPDLKPGTPDDVAVGADGILMTADDVYKLPLAGVTVSIIGTNLTAVTDAQGRFSFPSVPSGDLKLAVTGNTAINAPAGYYFPEMVMDLNILPGVANTVMAAMVRSGTGNNQPGASLSDSVGVYLPRLQTSLLQEVSSSTGAHIGVTAANAPNLPSQQRSELTLDVPANSIIGADGQAMISAQIGVSTVDPALVMDMLPAGLMQHTFDITVQAPGVATFSTPVAMTFPNVFNAAPGTKLNFLSFDHTTGRLVIEGTATVSADGLSVHTDPGTGVTHPGWHGLTPPGGEQNNDVGTGQGGNGSTSGNGSVDGDKDGDGRPDKDKMPPDPDGQTYEVGLSIDVGVPANSLFLEPFFHLALPQPLPNYDYSLKFAYPPQGLTQTFNVGSIDFTVSNLVSHALPENAQYQLFNVRGDLNGTGSAGAEIKARFGSLLNTVNFSTTLGIDLSASLTATVSGGLIDWLPSIVKQFVSQPRTFDIPIPPIEGIKIPAQSISLPFSIPDFLRNQSFDLGATAGIHVGASILISPVIYIKHLTGAGTLPGSAGSSPEFPTEAPPALDETSAGYSLSDGFGSDPRAYYRYIFGTNSQISGISDPSGHFKVFLPANQDYTLVVYRPSTNAWEIVSGNSGASGLSSSVVGHLTQTGGKDSDGDGIPDLGEFVLGTDPTRMDSDQDGITDDAELTAGSDPLGGFNSRTGIVTSVKLQGNAKAISVVGSTIGAKSQIAYVASGAHGLAIVNADDPQRLRILSQLELPGGDATDVSVDPNLKIAAVADNAGGLVFINVQNPTDPAVLRRIAINTAAVEAFDGVAYVSAGGGLRSYDLLSGELLQSLTVSSGNITSIARDGTFLYTFSSTNFLRVIDIRGSKMVGRGSLVMPAGGGRIFVGGGIAYVGAGSFNSAGFATASVANPDNLSLLSDVDAPNIEGDALAANGSGLLITVGHLRGPVGEDFAAMDLLNVSDPTNTAGFLTRIDLPDDPLDIVLAGGLAFVADGESGLQVINYIAFDDKGISPDVALTTDGLDIDPVTPGIQVLEGSTLTFRPSVTDDVQARNVELLINGQIVANDLSFPFDLSAILPTRDAGSATVTVQVRAIDTGGNVGRSQAITLNLVPDTTPPLLVSSNPPESSVRPLSLRTITLDFSESVVLASLMADDFLLTGPGAVAVKPQSVQLRHNATELELTVPELLPGDWVLTINKSLIADRSGNSLQADITIHFSVQLAVIIHYSLTDDWSDLQNPNGAWSYNQGNTPLTAQQFNWGGTISDSLSWTTTSSGTTPPAWTKTVHVQPEWHDWQPGDVVVHSTNFTGDSDLLANTTWTSPADGTITISGRAWDAFFGGSRDASWELYVNGTLYASRASVLGSYRTDVDAPFDEHLLPGMSLQNIPVAAGDVVKFEVASPNTFGWYTGVELDIDLASIPPAPMSIPVESSVPQPARGQSALGDVAPSSPTLSQRKLTLQPSPFATRAIRATASFRTALFRRGTTQIAFRPQIERTMDGEKRKRSGDWQDLYR